jgi:hypothetical protein
MFSGVFKSTDSELVQRVDQSLDKERTLIRYRPDSDFYIVAESSNKLYTYKNQFRVFNQTEVLYLEAQTTSINTDLYTLSLKRVSKTEASTIYKFYSLNNIPFNMESYKIGHKLKLLSWKHSILDRRTELLEMVYFDIKTKKREVKRKIFNKGTMKFQKSVFTQPERKFLILFYIKSGYKLVYRIYNFENNSMSKNFGLINDMGPNEFLKCEDNLDFIINFRFSGILQGNFKQFKKPEMIPNTAHMFRSNMTSYGAEEDCYYRLVDDFRTTRLEEIAFVEEEESPKIGAMKQILVKSQSHANVLTENEELSNKPQVRVLKTLGDTDSLQRTNSTSRSSLESMESLDVVKENPSKDKDGAQEVLSPSTKTQLSVSHKSPTTD